MKRIIWLSLVAASYGWAAGTTVLFQPSMTVGPFPTDALTTVNFTQQTGVQVNLPIPSNCGEPALSVCTNNALLNQLDGFSTNPMIVVCFSGAINPNTLANGIQIYPLTSFGPAIGIDQILYDPASNCMYAKPLQVLNQQSPYLLVVTNAVRDSSGNPTMASSDFTSCIKGGSTYCDALAVSAGLLGLIDGFGKNMVAASVFTTMSATSWVQKAYQVVNSAMSPVTELPSGALPGNPSVFSLASLSSINWVPAQSGLPPQPIPLTALAGVDRIAFGAYLSPNFLNVSGANAGTITPTPTAEPISPPIAIPGLTGVPAGYEPVSFHVFLPPVSMMPAGGFPVVIYGHGLSDSQFGAPTYIASTLASKGFATLAIEITGHGYGSASYVELAPKSGNPSIVATPGRGVLIPGNTTIGTTDGCILPGPLAVRDCGRQTAVDLFAMVRTIKATNGLGLGINPGKIYYIGQSFGSIYGTLFHAVDPAVPAAVLNVNGATDVMVSELSPIAQALATLYLETNNPPLLNSATPPYFNMNYVFRNSPPVVNTVPGAMPIQQALEVAEWLDMNGDALAFGPHLKTAPLPGVPAKSTLVQFAYGDLEVPNPTNSAFIRAAGLQAASWYYRFDIAAGLQPELLGILQPGVSYPIMPHRFLSNPTIFDAGKGAENSVAMAAQQQVAAYLASGGTANPNPNPFLGGVFAGQTLFQIPATLPETLNYLIPLP